MPAQMTGRAVFSEKPLHLRPLPLRERGRFCSHGSRLWYSPCGLVMRRAYTASTRSPVCSSATGRTVSSPVLRASDGGSWQGT